MKETTQLKEDGLGRSVELFLLGEIYERYIRLTKSGDNYAVSLFNHPFFLRSMTTLHKVYNGLDKGEAKIIYERILERDRKKTRKSLWTEILGKRKN